MNTLTAKLINVVVIAGFLAFSLVTSGIVSGLAFIVAAFAVVPLLTPEPQPYERTLKEVDKILNEHPEVFKS